MRKKREQEISGGVVGVLKKRGKYFFVEPDNRDYENIIITKDKKGGALTGQKVFCGIEKQGAGLHKGRVLRVLGNEGDLGAETLSIIMRNEIPFEFNEKVKKEASFINDTVTEADLLGRTDLRKLLTVTIDGEDTKDFDDAVTIDKKDGKFLLGVHIADVAHYVREKSAIDKEALLRGNSVYLPDRVIPMLPFKLSNGICSLKAGEDRLALSVTMVVDENGGVIDSTIEESVININRRFTYTKVTSIIEGAEEEAEFTNMFKLMGELAAILENKRINNGALDFDVPESKIIMGKDGHVTNVYRYNRNIATKIIEEFMVLCNETVAERFFFTETPFVYRTHEPPDIEKAMELSDFLRGMGRSVKGGKNALTHPKELQKILNGLDSSPDCDIVKKGILRAMKQASYRSVNIGHFGLSLRRYCHFTSPIRRYADLQIHRIIKESMAGKIDDKRHDRLVKRTEAVASHVSKTERAAVTVEREVAKLFKCDYMFNKIGMVFDGVISYAAKHGIYVELKNTVEGMVPLYTIQDDYYVYDSRNLRFVGEHTGRVYKIGDVVKVKVKSVSITDRYIDFIFV